MNLLREEPAISLGIFTVEGFLDSNSEIGAVLVAIYEPINVGRFNRFVTELQ
jgi:hypothetical protein